MLSNQHLREGGIAGLRRAPDSYGRLIFHSQIVRIWIGQERAEPGAGEISLQPAMYLARYRLVPLALLPPDSPPEAGTRSDDLLPESGLPDSVDAAAPWDRARRPGEGRPVDYLREELRRRLQAGPAVELLLQVQLHRAEDPGERRGSALAWYDASVDWDETVTPWQNLGRIDLTQALGAAETERLRFNPAHHPLNFGVPEAVSLLDPRSLGASELRVMSAISSLRAGLAAVLWLPVEEGR